MLLIKFVDILNIIPNTIFEQLTVIVAELFNLNLQQFLCKKTPNNRSKAFTFYKIDYLLYKLYNRFIMVIMNFNLTRISVFI